MKILNRTILFGVFMMILSSAAFAAEETASPAAAPAGMDPAVMEKMKALMAPGEPHKALEAFTGKWTYTGKFWMAPDTPPQEMTGTATNAMIFAGRFLKQEIEGPWMGENFQGIGYTGYDNIKGSYETVWIDSMGTGIMTSSGQYTAATQTLSQAGANSCPLTGEKARPGRSEWTVVDHDHSTYSSYLNGPDGKEFKAMELTYTRVP